MSDYSRGSWGSQKNALAALKMLHEFYTPWRPPEKDPLDITDKDKADSKKRDSQSLILEENKNEKPTQHKRPDEGYNRVSY